MRRHLSSSSSLTPAHLEKEEEEEGETPSPSSFLFPGQLIKVRNAGNLSSSFPPPIPLSPRSGGKIGEKEQADFPYATTKIYYDFLLCHLLEASEQGTYPFFSRNNALFFPGISGEDRTGSLSRLWPEEESHSPFPPISGHATFLPRHFSLAIFHPVRALVQQMETATVGTVYVERQYKFKEKGGGGKKGKGQQCAFVQNKLFFSVSKAQMVLFKSFSFVFCLTYL